MKYNTIVVDAMGGDHAPAEIIKGAALACRESDTLKYIFVGDVDKMLPLIEKEHRLENRYEIVHTTDVITMEESPKKAVEEKPDATINIAARLIRDGKGDALVSAGSTGATVMACSQTIPRMPSVERGVIATVFPAMKQKKEDPGISIILDIGATLHCTVNQLISFAIMGIHYLQAVMAVENPRVALLNIGTEETKGHEVLQQTYQKLKENPDINFIGNIEGKDIMRGITDVIVTEGYIGNVALKSIEGMAEISFETGKQIWKKSLLSKAGFIMLAPKLKKLKKRLDYSEYGGAPILGFKKLIVKAHGRSEAKAIKNAILLAEKSATSDLVKNIEKSMKAFYLRMFDGET